jgi:hypothetical protein
VIHHHSFLRKTHIPGVIYVIAVGHHSQQVVLQRPVDGDRPVDGGRHDGDVGDHADADDVLMNY